MELCRGCSLLPEVFISGDGAGPGDSFSKVPITFRAWKAIL